jgi:hypothetical protein
MNSKQSRSPLKAAPLRLPGQSVEEQREKLISDTIEQWAFMALVFVVLAGLEWWRWYIAMKPMPEVFTLAAVVLTAFAAWKVRRAIPQLRKLRQARDGERAVGQFLERLRESGYHVFHDIVGKDFNVDHLLIGPSGVYTVETKTWSKPVGRRAEIAYDGDRLKAGDFQPDRDPIVQAKAQASWIKHMLFESAGKQAFVRPVVVFPGWFIASTAGAMKDVWVLEPKALPAFLENQPARLSPEDVKLFSFHVSRAIRTTETS